MFRNYQELFSGYVEFYRSNLFAEVTSSAASIISGNPAQTFFVHHQEPGPGAKRREVSSSNSASNVSLPVELSSFGREPAAINQFRAKLDETVGAYRRALEENFNTLEEYIVGSGELDGRMKLALEAGDAVSSPAIGSTLIEEGGRQITIGSFNKLDLADFLLVLGLFLSFILAKRKLSLYIKRSESIASLGLRQKDNERLDECIWRLIFYTFSSTWLVYSCFIEHNSMFLFSGDSTSFKEYSFTVDLDEYVICLIETSFYLHATYALIYEDVWRRDSPMMLLHHVMAIFSVLSVYATRTHKLGLAIVVLRDTCDVLLEMTKLAKCLHIQHGKKVKSVEVCTKFFLSIFALSFVVNQLYYYPLFCLYHGLNVAKVYKLRSPTVVGMVTCGLIFLLLDLAWFLLILRLLYRMLFSKNPLKDLREYDEDEDESEKIKEEAGSSKENWKQSIDCSKMNACHKKLD